MARAVVRVGRYVMLYTIVPQRGVVSYFTSGALAHHVLFHILRFLRNPRPGFALDKSQIWACPHSGRVGARVSVDMGLAGSDSAGVVARSVTKNGSNAACVCFRLNVYTHDY